MFDPTQSHVSLSLPLVFWTSLRIVVVVVVLGGANFSTLNPQLLPEKKQQFVKIPPGS